MALTLGLPTLYEHYTGGGIYDGLNANKPYFTLNHKNITIYSGAMHYFRVPPEYWRDRLRKLRAAGLNTVETYIPWNLHEPQSGVYDFGQGDSDMQEFLNLAKFLRTAQEEDLLAIIRPGPFICSEWEFGGFPSWLLRDKNVKLRTSDTNYMKFVTRYFNILLPLLALFQFTRGGPIVAFQVENEYGSTEKKGSFVPDRTYLWQLRQLMLDNGIVELLVSADSPTMHGDIGTLPNIFLQTANFASDPEKEFDKLKELQPNKPTMAMEFWTGWFDHWSEMHHTRNNDDFYNVYQRILKYPASVNMYMFHGGTSFGFMNGANLNNDKLDNSGYQPDTTSYDYDAPLSEAGDYTIKYIMVKELLATYNPIITRIPLAPAISRKRAFPAIPVQAQLNLEEIILNIRQTFQGNLIPMEYLPMNNMSGQSYGYIIYRKRNLNIRPNSVLTIGGHICDTVVVMIDGILMSKPLTQARDLDGFGSWRTKNSNLTLGPQEMEYVTLDLIVENWGRNNFGYLDQFNQYKGIWQDNVYINNEKIMGYWDIIPLEFRKSWTNSLTGWHYPYPRWAPGPSLYKSNFYVDEPEDTFINMEEWIKGIVMINGFVLGRYSRIGPQQTLYLPAPFLKKGNNVITVFEHYIPATQIKFSKQHIFKTNNSLNK